MNKKLLIAVVIIILGVVGSLVFTNTFSHTSSPTITPSVLQQQGTMPQGSTSATQATSQNPEDVIPGLYPNPIQNTATTEGFKITSIMAENNTDASGNAVNDHLQLTLQNLTQQDLSNFEIYYTITDSTTNKKEGYYKKLNNYILKAGATQTIHFDNQQGLDHFSANTHGLEYTSTNMLNFTVIVSTPGYKIETATITKGGGGADPVN